MYAIGVDLGRKEGDCTAVSLCEWRDGTMYVLGTGQDKNCKVAYRMAVACYLKDLPWWKRPWKRFHLWLSFVLKRVDATVE